jgi:hypothetical protein
MHSNRKNIKCVFEQYKHVDVRRIENMCYFGSAVDDPKSPPKNDIGGLTLGFPKTPKKFPFPIFVKPASQHVSTPPRHEEGSK